MANILKKLSINYWGRRLESRLVLSDVRRIRKREDNLVRESDHVVSLEDYRQPHS